MKGMLAGFRTINCAVWLAVGFVQLAVSVPGRGVQPYLGRTDTWFAGEEAKRLAENILTYQSDLGGWPKNMDTIAQPFTGERAKISPTFDNGATTDELRFLARMHSATGEVRYRRAFVKGYDYILKAQYPTGGWPQFYPPPARSYHRHITFNDNSMVRLMEFLRETYTTERYRFLEDQRIRAAREAFDHGVECILKCQIKVDGRLAAWCAQHDENNYAPRSGRAYELVSLSGAESVRIVRLLMSLDHPSPAVVQAVEGAVSWFKDVQINGVKVVVVADPASPTGKDKRLAEDAAATPLWARFYEIGSNRPIYCDRDGVAKYKLSEIGYERRNGYAWLGDWPRALMEKEYPAWKRKFSATIKPIDRKALVTRHNVVLAVPDALAPLTVGNGEFAFTVDVTGLQTFPANYRAGIQLGTQSQWGWDSAPNPDRFVMEDVLTPYDARGRQVVYRDGQGKLKNAGNPDRAKKANTWLRENPHRVQLGRLGLTLLSADQRPVKIDQLQNIRQTLDLWTGRIESRFEWNGQPVLVETVCHPERDLVAARIESPLVAAGSLGAELTFDDPGKHTGFSDKPGRCDIQRNLQSSNYFAALAWSEGAILQFGKDRQYLVASNRAALEITLAFSLVNLEKCDLPIFAETRTAAAQHWQRFWLTGGAVDLSESRDPRWRELERRIVLSQYLTAIQCAGSLPPQETGLVQNSWFGKFHLEMHWWHAAHFALWGRTEMLEHSLGWYERIQPAARALAQRNGYQGARWPKMVGPDGDDSPSGVGGFLIWQQPHPIYFAELLYRAKTERATLEKYRGLVMATAEFMASYAVWDKTNKTYGLGPPLIPAQESYGKLRDQVVNPTFELAYWYWGLQVAQQWRARLGLPREPRWDEISSHLTRPFVRAGRYEAIAVEPFTLTQDHPSMLQAYGFVPPTPLIEPAIMERTLDFVLKKWNWSSTWGWDYPVVAMTAARLGRGEDAVAGLLLDTPKNRYHASGHNYQRPGLPLYLPGNGGLLAAVAMMAAGWDGAPAKPAPGFPDNGQWIVRWEGLRPMP